MKNISSTKLFPAKMRKFLPIMFVALVLFAVSAEDSFGYSDYDNYGAPVSQSYYYDSYNYYPSYPCPPAPKKRSNFWVKFAPVFGVCLAVAIRNNWDQLKEMFN